MPRAFARILPLLAVVLILPLACRTSSSRPELNPKEVEYEVLFAEPDHEIDWCLKKALADSYASTTDSTIFYDRDTVIRIKVPTGPGKEPYHAHLLHWRQDRLHQHFAAQGPDGSIKIPLSQFERPETLILTSAALRMLDAKDKVALRDKPLLAPYAMSFHLAERQTAPVLASLQPFRYEWNYRRGNAALFVQSFCRSQMLLNLLDLDGKAGFLMDESYYHSKDLDAYLTPHVILDMVDKTGRTLQRVGTYSAAETAWKDSRPFSLRFLDKELIAFAPPPRVEISMPEDDPAKSATITARFKGIRPKSKLHFVLAAGYPLGTRERTGVRAQTEVITEEKQEGTYVVSLDDLDSTAFPMTGYVAHRLVEPFRTAHGMYAPCEPLGRFATPFFGESIGRLHPKVLVPRHAGHYDLIYWLGSGGGENEARKFLLAYYSGNAPGSGVPGDGPSATMVPPPNFGIPDNNPGGGFTTVPSENSTTPGGGSGSSYGSDSNSITPQPWWGLWLGDSAPDPDPASSPGTIAITIKCGCGMDFPDTEENECKCGKHFWNLGQIQKGIAQAAVSSCPPGFSIADTAWFGSHSASSPCHTWVQIGMARVSYWGPNFTTVHVWYRVKVTFAPCKGKGKKPGGPTGESGTTGEEGKPEYPKRRAEGFGTLVSGIDGDPIGCVDELPEVFPQALDTPAWNPSTDPNASTRLIQLVATLRRNLGLTDLPFAAGGTWTAPTKFLHFTNDGLAAKITDLVEWQKGFTNAYWGRKDRRKPLPPSELRDVLGDWGIYGAGERGGSR